MRNILFLFCVCVLLCTTAHAKDDERNAASRKAEEAMRIVNRIKSGSVPYPTEQELAVFEEDSWGLRNSRAELARDKALEDVAANIPFLLLIRKDFGESFLEWVIPIAEKLPSQPVAVIQLMTNIANWNDGQYIDKMCPMAVIEDSITFEQYKNWLERSVTALESFTMHKTEAEKTRRVCLGKIKSALATTKPW